MKILLVDDDKVDRTLIIRALRSSTLEVDISEAMTVDQGLQMFAANHYDIVLLDYLMPQRNGIEMILELRRESKHNSTAIIMMSTLEDENISLECIQAGAQDFLLKSEISSARLKRALMQATTRFELETKLYNTYQTVKSLAETDSLTGLANRYHFDESFKHVLSINHRSKTKVALLLFDLDNFKLVNDTFGHDVGDDLLKQIVSRIKKSLRGNEVFARLGGDEFAIMLGDLNNADQAGQIARRIISALYKPFDIASTSVKVTASLGISLYPDNGNSSEELFKNADIAMYRAKKNGRNQVCYFEEEMQHKFHHRVQTEAELRVAMEKQQFELYYQPVINPISNKLQGFEALIRWNVDGKVRTPYEFMHIAEETRQILPIGFWVIEEAIARLAQWNEKYNCSLTMAINVSAHQLSDPSLVKYLESCLQRHNVAAELIDIELTETALFKDNDETRNIIFGISELKCRLSLDDFGTGFSSLSHLRNYPIKVIKIDRSLMPANENDTKHTALIQSLVSMGNILGLDIVAEGVETEYQLSLCHQFNIEHVQGYYFSPPLTQQSIEEKYLNQP